MYPGSEGVKENSFPKARANDHAPETLEHAVAGRVHQNQMTSYLL
jgi:hypothetical protein